MEIQNGTPMSKEENAQSLSKQPATENLSETQGEIKLYPLTYEIIESAEEASSRVMSYMVEHREEWKKMTDEEKFKIIDQIFAQVD